MKQIIYRNANNSDAQAIQNILFQSITNLCSADHHNDKYMIQEWCRNKTIENITEWLIDSDNFTLVVTIFEKVIGVGMIQHNEILLLYLLPDFINKGIGKALLKQLEQHAKQRNFHEIIVKSTITALNFYQSQGYKYSDKPVDKDIYLIKKLD